MKMTVFMCFLLLNPVFIQDNVSRGAPDPAGVDSTSRVKSWQEYIKDLLPRPFTAEEFERVLIFKEILGVFIFIIVVCTLITQEIERKKEGW